MMSSMQKKDLIVFNWFVVIIFICSWLQSTAVNPRPIIGVLSIDSNNNTAKECNSTDAVSELVASYVKFIEMAGARVVPIFLNKSDDYYKKLLPSINGVLFPGGGIYLNQSNYAKAAKFVYDFAVNVNDNNNTYFPIWGTCLGFEMLAQLISNDTAILSNCSAKNISLPLNMTSGFSRSRLFGDIQSYMLSMMTTKNLTYNNHEKCLTPTKVNSTTLKSNINILSINEDKTLLPFVSIYEAFRYPFYGVQWHPEKNPFEWDSSLDIPHSHDAVLVSQYFANFFVSEAKKNNQKFKEIADEKKSLIGNYHENLCYLENGRELYMFFNNTL